MKAKVTKDKITDPKATGYKPRAKRYDVADTTVPGLNLRVNPTGLKSWVVRIWRPFKKEQLASLDNAERKNKRATASKAKKKPTGKYTSKTIGIFKQDRRASIEMTTEEAQEQARIELALVGRKGSLSQHEAFLKTMPTLSEWFDKFAKKNPRHYAASTMSDHCFRMENHIGPRLGSMQLHEITSAHLEDLTLTVENEVGGRTANMCRILIGILLDWCDGILQ